MLAHSLSVNGKDKLRILHSSIPSIVEDLRNIITAGWEGEILSEVNVQEFFKLLVLRIRFITRVLPAVKCLTDQVLYFLNFVVFVC